MTGARAGHPEATCQRCGRPNIVWFTPNDVWNRVMPDDGGILCPVCFVQSAERAGIVAVWRLAPEPQERDAALTLIADMPLDQEAPPAEAGDAAAADYFRQRAYAMVRIATGALPPQPREAA